MESNCEISPAQQCPTTADESIKKQHQKHFGDAADLSTGMSN